MSLFTAYQILSTDARNLSSNRTRVSVHFHVQRTAFSCPSCALNASTLSNFFCVVAWYLTGDWAKSCSPVDRSRIWPCCLITATPPRHCVFTLHQTPIALATDHITFHNFLASYGRMRLITKMTHAYICTTKWTALSLRWSGSGSVIPDHSDHSRSSEPINARREWINRFIWSNMIRVIWDHWSWPESPQKNAPYLAVSTDLVTKQLLARATSVLVSLSWLIVSAKIYCQTNILNWIYLHYFRAST